MEQRTSPTAQWLELRASNAGVMDSDPCCPPCVASPKKKDKWSRIESHAVNPHIYGQLIFDKGRKIIQGGKNSLFNNCMSTCKRNMKLDLSYHTIHRIYRNKLRVDQRPKCKH